MAGNRGWQIELTADSYLQARVGDGTQLLSINGNTALNDGKEHQVTLIYKIADTNGFRLLQDGEEIF